MKTEPPSESSILTRRDFLGRASAFGAGLGLLGWAGCKPVASTAEPLFRISLAEWSLHRAIFDEKSLDHLDFAKTAKREFGIEAVEYVNQMFKDKARDQAYLAEMKTRAEGEGVRSLLIMVDGEGALGDTDEAKRLEAVENHVKWLEAAQFLGCHSIRVNAAGRGTRAEVAAAAVDGLGRLATRGKEFGLNVIVENHGGYSSDGAWLSGVMSQVGMDNCGTLPDFGNFCIERTTMADGSHGCADEYDRYQGVTELMPFAKAVSAKSHDFDEAGNETHTDYTRMMRIVTDAGYHGFVGIEYEGHGVDEMTGIQRTLDLLVRVRDELTASA